MDNNIVIHNTEMLESLYDFQATFAKTLSFTEGEYFYWHQTNTKQRNWWQVVNNKGQVGFVPSNYVAVVKVDPDFFIKFLNDSINTIAENSPLTSDKQELIAILTEKKRQLQLGYKSSTKKHQAPKPPLPDRIDSCSPAPSPVGVPPTLNLTNAVVSQQNIDDLSPLTSDRDNTETNESLSILSQRTVEENKVSSSKEDCEKYSNRMSPTSSHSLSEGSGVRSNALYDMVQSVRKETQLSHEMSKVAVETVLHSLKEFLPEGAARSVIDALLREANSNNVTCPQSAYTCAPDALRLRSALNALSRATNDAQQRGWALHDDAHDIQTELLELISVMSNADMNISQHVLRCDHYSYVTTLVQYYQMETRWPIRQLLLQAFGVMCGLERTALGTLAMSSLPAEIARDMRDNPQSVPRLSHSALLLSMVLSMADKLPVTYFEQMGVDFCVFLLELIESPPDTDIDEQIPDLFLTLVLAYNLQFKTSSENFVLDSLEVREFAKTFTQKVLFLLNREDDPVRMFDHEPAPPHSVLKLFVDLFSRASTADLFYTNDVKVMIDIIVRQLADLSPGDERRQQYLKLMAGALRNTDYGSHRHRLPDLLRCFARIFCEEGELSAPDQALVKSISNQFPQYFKL